MRTFKELIVENNEVLVPLTEDKKELKVSLQSVINTHYVEISKKEDKILEDLSAVHAFFTEDSFDSTKLVAFLKELKDESSDEDWYDEDAVDFALANPAKAVSYFSLTANEAKALKTIKKLINTL